MNTYNSKIQNIFVDRDTWRAINFFWLGYMIYIFFYSLTAQANVNFILVQLFQSVGLGLMFISIIKLLRNKFDNPYLGIVFRFYMVWLVLIVMRGFTTDFELIKKLLFDGWFGVFIYAVPLLALFPRNLDFYRRTFDVITVLGGVTLLLYALNLRVLTGSDLEDLLGREILETVSRSLGVTTGFILLTYMYHSRSRKILAWAVIGLTIFFAILRARRGLIIMALSPAIITYIIFLYRAKVKSFVIVASVIVGVWMIDYGITVYLESDTFRYLQQRGLEDTRSGVEVMYYKDMDAIDWMFGKGMNGSYYCPGIDLGYSSGYRTVIETDFLQMILKGGLVSLGLLFAILVPAMYYGLFRSQNYLSKAAAVWIFLAILNMYPSTVNTVTLNYLLVWICVGICYSPTIRNLPDQVVKAYFATNGRALLPEPPT